MDRLATLCMVNWEAVIKGASASLCIVLCESMTITLPMTFINKALPESTYDRARNFSDGIWSLENSMSLIDTIVIILTRSDSGMG